MKRAVSVHSIAAMLLSGACGAFAAACGRAATSGAAVAAVPVETRTAPVRESPPPPKRESKRREISARLEFPTARGAETRPQALLAADLDGDGRDELIAATMAPGSLQIWSGLSAEIRAAPEPRTIPIDDYPLGPVWVGGKKPSSKSEPALVAVASRTALELSVIDARAAFASSSAPEPAMRVKLEHRPRVLASGRLESSDRPVIAVVTIEDDIVLVKDAHDVRHMRLCDDHATCARFLDDASGMVFGFQGTRRIVIYVKSAMSADIDPIGLEPGPSVVLPGLPRALDEVDLDGDGDTELVVAGGDKSLWIFGLGRPGGWKTWFDAPPLEIETAPVPMEVMHADFDRDGKTDLLSLALHGQECALYSGASFVAARSASGAPKIDRLWRVYAGQQPMWTALGDFDGDGNLDVAISNPGAKRVSVMFGDGKGGVRTAESVAAGPSPKSIAGGDLDGDGYPEVVGLNAHDNTLSTYKNEKGVLRAGKEEAPAETADGVRCADVDGDGKIDALYLQHPNDASSLATLYGDGRGRLAPRADKPPVRVGETTGDLLVADPRGTGELVAIATDPARDRIALVPLRGSEAAESTSAVTYVTLSPGPRALALLPERGGKTSLIAVALGGPGEPRGVAFLHCVSRKGTGLELVADPDALRMSLFPVSIAAADLDGDGEMDLAVLATQSGGDSQGFVVPWLHAKSGEWRALDPMPTGLLPYRIAAGDLDGDGRAEILVSAQNSHHVNLWTSIGAPVPPGSAAPRFVRCPDLGVGTGPLDLALIDLDRDGVPELVVANAFSNDLSVIRVR
jgi:hypothetical protein